MYSSCSKDEDAVKAIKELRLTADDFEVKGIIGRGHFGEVVMNSPLYHDCPRSCKHVQYGPHDLYREGFESHTFNWPQS